MSGAEVQFTAETQTTGGILWGPGALQRDHGVSSPKCDVLDFPAGVWFVEWEYAVTLQAGAWDVGEVVDSDGKVLTAASRNGLQDKPVKLGTTISGPGQVRFKYVSSRSVHLTSTIKARKVA